mmetsp:Transcript_21672/g.40845  ORF Transcript_21672/g.40845 Transcript_21672/m.40845 type:complete len:90 (+) Transcript_21672:418-687(+)
MKKKVVEKIFKKIERWSPAQPYTKRNHKYNYLVVLRSFRHCLHSGQSEVKYYRPRGRDLFLINTVKQKHSGGESYMDISTCAYIQVKVK